jgi:phospholipase C
VRNSNTSNKPFDPSRRRILTGLAATGAGGLVGCSGSSSSGGSLPNPENSGIDHIVVVMMENRSFDHVLGWLPGANGVQDGLSFTDKKGKTQSTFQLTDLLHRNAYGYQGCGKSDPDHSYEGGRTQYNNGAMDGFLQTQPAGDQFPIGYYTRDDVPFFSGCADNWTICDAYHCGILSCTLPNRMYMHTGQTDRITNSFNTCTLPTIWDRCINKSVACKYYYADTPVLALWGSKYTKDTKISFKLDQFVADFGAGGTPPSVSYVDPYMGLAIGEALGTSWDDHAFADIRNGQAFLNYIYTVLSNSPVWERTLLIINYDEWGGFYDHVAPSLAPVSVTEQNDVGNDGRLGFRVPCIAIGPRVRRGHVEHTQFDPNSILNMICWRFGMEPLGVRGGSSANFAHALDFSKPADTSAPVLDVPAGPFTLDAPYTPPDSSFTAPNAFGGSCLTAVTTSQEAFRQYQQHVAEVRTIQALGRQHGFGL